nr:hypothetical protein [Kibdelosporangium sp. MJ126-NF4]
MWSLGYGGLTVSWALGGRTYPYGANDPGAEHASLLSTVPTGIAAPVLACVILLTVGLIRPWGEVFPRWIPRLGGRPVPPGLPLWSGGLVAVILTMANVSLAHRSITTGEPMDVLFRLWVLWGLGLGGATLAYYYRTRGRCRRCDCED